MAEKKEKEIEALPKEAPPLKETDIPTDDDFDLFGAVQNMMN